ncbi:prolipoprotein diacylglyceryl transferase [Fonticella tunisiensis]|uniref:Phosphatidylglycerol--prolipoprotein diacylglyceryl transferase n=1 Tax=Fonticella tunisiensis TaxID=1096341 RepID=A0A4R7K981_9CLOT|nr:prolipoprotein diacylglyceryl transferase [Fonticella tunisiensis]TDT50549.1 prolipoprotein diacylglyceryl transferase [Fonticella tunisiensis]
MYPVLLRIGNFVVHGYGLMIALGIAAAIITAMYRAKRRGLSKDAVADIAIYGIIGGVIGAKLLFLIVEAPYIIKNPVVLKDMLAAGFVIYGGIIGGALAAYIYCRRKKLNFLPYFDLIAPSISIAQGFGRIGCLFAGCCYGKVTAGPLGIVFNNSPFVAPGVKRIPTQIYSSLGNFIIAAILLIYASKPRNNGKVAGLYMILYSIGRFVIEFYRDDPRGSLGLLSTSQFICIFILIGGVLLFNLTHCAALKSPLE